MIVGSANVRSLRTQHLGRIPANLSNESCWQLASQCFLLRPDFKNRCSQAVSAPIRAEGWKGDWFSTLLLKLHDVVEPNFIKPVAGKADEHIIDITGVAETVFVSGEIEGAPSGEILLQKL
jgi:hypothetical protein